MLFVIAYVQLATQKLSQHEIWKHLTQLALMKSEQMWTAFFEIKSKIKAQAPRARHAPWKDNVCTY